MEFSNFTEILMYWFHEKRNDWFSPNGSDKQKEIDVDISEKFGSTLTSIEDSFESEYKFIELISPHSLLAIIVVLDQFSRHIYRTEQSRKSIMRNDRWALKLSELIFDKGWDKLLTEPQLIIALMPRRHAANPSTIPENPIIDTERVTHLRYVLETLDNRNELVVYNNTLIDKFWKATHERQTILFQKILKNNASFKDSDILDKDVVFNSVSIENIMDEPIVKIFNEFRLNLQRKARGDPKRFGLHPRDLNLHAQSNPKNLYVSLSGGVDSMITAFILNSLNPDITVVAIHIDYGNRPESFAEAEYIEKWCESQTPQIIFRKKTMGSMLRRGVTPRKFYEEKTRSIRFDTYKEVIKEFTDGGIYVGHNFDDIQENVLSNINGKGSILDLSGMHPSNIIDDVCILRPLLPVNKEEIFEFAHKYGIPYFKDTTPRNSVRGMLRQKLKPLLQRIYGTNMLKSLNYLAKQSSDLFEMTNELVWKPILSNVHQSKLGIWINYRSYKDYPLYFWKQVITILCNRIGMGYIGDNLLETILIPTMYKKDGLHWIQLKKNLMGCMDKENLFLIPSHLFETSVKNKKNEMIPINAEKFEIMGWSVGFELVDELDDRKNVCLSSSAGKTRVSMCEAHKNVLFVDIMNGSFSYYLPKSDKYFISSSKRHTPSVFQGGGLDKRIKSILPIVCLEKNFGGSGKLVKLTYNFMAS